MEHAEVRKQVLARLETRVKERTSELKATAVELENLNRSIASRVRRPAQKVGSLLLKFEDSQRQLLSPRGCHFLDRMLHSCEKVGRMIDDLLALSAIQQQAMKNESIDADRMVREIWAEFAADASTAIEFRLRSLPSHRGDPELMRQLWSNLLDNAVKYSGLEDSPRITVESFTEDGRTWFRVEDNGVGFNPDYQSRMFGMFQRLHRDDEFPGDGIGLATVSRILDRCGGEIRVWGAPGEGARFEFSP